MNPSKFLALVVVLCACGIFAFRYGSKIPEMPSSEQLQEHQSVFGLSESEIDSVTIHHPGRAEIFTKLERHEGDWLMSEPIQDLADPAAIHSLLGAVCRDARMELPKEWQGQANAALGLEPAQASVEVNDLGENPLLLKIGVADLSGDFYAASLKGQNFLIHKRTHDVLLRAANSWRSPMVFQGGNRVTDITLFKPEATNPYVQFAQRGRTWWMVHPNEIPVNQQGLNYIARLLRSRVLDLREDVATTSQRNYIQEQGYRMQLLNSNRVEEYWYRDEVVCTDQRQYFLPVLAEDFELLAQRPQELMSNRLFQLLVDEVISLQIQIGETATTYRKSADGWQTVNGNSLSPEQSQHLDTLVKISCSLEATNPHEAPSTQKTGTLILSRSRTPLAKNGLEMKWWAGDGRKVLAANALGGETVLINRQFHQIATAASHW